jgi:hypothetical protein
MSKTKKEGLQVDEGALPFATPRQKEIAETVLACEGDGMAAATKLGISYGRVTGAMSEMHRRAALKGYNASSGIASPLPYDFSVTKITQHVNADGTPGQSWVRAKPEESKRFDLLCEAMEEAAASWENTAAPIKRPRSTNDEIMVMYPIGDPHIGLYAWAAETKDRDTDLQDGVDVLYSAVDNLVERAPAAKKAVIASVGDLLHADNVTNTTARSGHHLDVDTRFHKVYLAAVQMLIRLIQRALEKHEEVEFISAAGNHDDHSAFTLAVAVDMFFRGVEQFNVNYDAFNRVAQTQLEPGRFHYVRFGNNLIGVTHGDTVKPAKLQALMAVDRREDWGEVENCHWYIGHRHHDEVKEYEGCIVETIGTLAARDSYAASHGFRSRQSMRADVWHIEDGLEDRAIVSVRSLARKVERKQAAEAAKKRPRPAKKATKKRSAKKRPAKRK